MSSLASSATEAPPADKGRSVDASDGVGKISAHTGFKFPLLCLSPPTRDGAFVIGGGGGSASTGVPNTLAVLHAVTISDPLNGGRQQPAMQLDRCVAVGSEPPIAAHMLAGGRIVYALPSGAVFDLGPDATSGSQAVRLEALCRPSADDAVRVLSWSPSGEHVAALSSRGARIYRWPSLVALRGADDEAEVAVVDAAWSRSSNACVVATKSGSVVSHSIDGSAVLGESKISALRSLRCPDACAGFELRAVVMTRCNGILAAYNRRPQRRTATLAAMAGCAMLAWWTGGVASSSSSSSSWSTSKLVGLGADQVTALCVSPDGVWVAAGLHTGEVVVLSAGTTAVPSIVSRVAAHSWVVTGLTWLAPPRADTVADAADDPRECVPPPLLTISADSSARVSLVPMTPWRSWALRWLLVALLLLVLIVYAVLYFA